MVSRKVAAKRCVRAADVWQRELDKAADLLENVSLHQDKALDKLERSLESYERNQEHLVRKLGQIERRLAALRAADG